MVELRSGEKKKKTGSGRAIVKTGLSQVDCSRHSDRGGGPEAIPAYPTRVGWRDEGKERSLLKNNRWIAWDSRSEANTLGYQRGPRLNPTRREASITLNMHGEKSLQVQTNIVYGIETNIAGPQAGTGSR